ncbi:MAG: hypothetical protein R3A52_16485 [Polyangiales bacterium]
MKSPAKSGPSSRPPTPYTASPPKSERNTSSRCMFVDPRVRSGRSTLSLVATTPPPHRSMKTPAPTRPCARSTTVAGAHTIPEPTTGTKAKTKVTAAARSVEGKPTISHAMATSAACASASPSLATSTD